MAAATTQLNTPGRGPNAYCNVSVISVTVTGVATVYATATGGLPFDLTAALQAASGAGMQGGIAPNYIQTMNPNDIVGVLLSSVSTTGFLPLNFALGLPTYGPVPWQADNGPAATPGILLTCPCTIRLYGSGAANAAHLAEIADGATNEAFTMLLYINRNGANS